MYTFVYRTFIKFILFCHDINQDIARVLSFNALMGLSCYFYQTYIKGHRRGFNALMGLSCYLCQWHQDLGYNSFNALMGLSCYSTEPNLLRTVWCFNALMGLSCYGKNVQYFKFFMILFMHTCYL